MMGENKQKNTSIKQNYSKIYIKIIEIICRAGGIKLKVKLFSNIDSLWV
jgi:hypothetical protein